jgi:hypothetical protein
MASHVRPHRAIGLETISGQRQATSTTPAPSAANSQPSTAWYRSSFHRNGVERKAQGCKHAQQQCIGATRHRKILTSP